MKNRKIAGVDVVNSTRLLCSFSTPEYIQNIVDGIMKSHQLTKEFLNEFKDYINVENFTSSYMLSKELVDEYPDLFSYETYMQNILSLKPHISMLSEFFEDILSRYGEKDGKTHAEEEDDVVDIIENLVINCINDSTEQEVNDANAAAIVGSLGDKVDTVLLRKIKDESVREIIMLAIQLKGSENASSASLKYLTNDSKEEILGTDNVDPNTFINTLSESKDLGWVIKMINKAVSGEISLYKTTSVFDRDLIKFIAAMPESVVVSTLKLKEYMPNAVSYKVLYWTLQHKDLSEDDLIELKDIFKSSGMYFELKRFARTKEYNRLLQVL